MKKLKVAKFNLEKFEVAKLSDMKNIKGGLNDGGLPTGTDTSRLSSNVCNTLTAPSGQDTGFNDAP